MSVYLIATRDASNLFLSSGRQEITSLSEKKEALIQEVNHLKKVKQEIEEKQKEILADLQKQKKEWDAKNSALQAKNIRLQASNRALKDRAFSLTTKFRMHSCLPNRFYMKFYNGSRANHRKQNPGASAESFFPYLP
ncbi:MAG: hypothetical protein Q8L98_08670 [Chlamydiales bacterium]|nr:hypothetical protein [Chlamydiales bacterium]